MVRGGRGNLVRRIVTGRDGDHVRPDRPPAADVGRGVADDPQSVAGDLVAVMTASLVVRLTGDIVPFEVQIAEATEVETIVQVVVPELRLGPAAGSSP